MNCIDDCEHGFIDSNNALSMGACCRLGYSWDKCRGEFKETTEKGEIMRPIYIKNKWIEEQLEMTQNAKITKGIADTSAYESAIRRIDDQDEETMLIIKATVDVIKRGWMQ